jgi:hypothetical protein
MGEYRRCAQGRRTVDEYYEEFLELRAFCPSKGDDLEQKVQFRQGLNPELAHMVMHSPASNPSATQSQRVELARNLSDLAPKRTAAVRAVHDQGPSFGGKSHMECYNCGKQVHFSADCTKPRKPREDRRDGERNDRRGEGRGGGRGGRDRDRSSKMASIKDKDKEKDKEKDTPKDKDKSSNVPEENRKRTSIRSSSRGVCRLNSRPSRASPVFEIAAKSKAAVCASAWTRSRV